jgi:uncharacterized tellurite resistance protein B-like protein
LNFTQLDKSNYLKGLLIVARKDNQLAEQEKNILKSISEKLGFATDFYQEAIKNLLVNKHISEEPIKFSNRKIASSFISDGLNLAYSDNKIHQAEIEWLKKTAEANQLDNNWFHSELNKMGTEIENSVKANLKLYSII